MVTKWFKQPKIHKIKSRKKEFVFGPFDLKENIAGILQCEFELGTRGVINISFSNDKRSWIANKMGYPPLKIKGRQTIALHLPVLCFRWIRFEYVRKTKQSKPITLYFQMRE